MDGDIPEDFPLSLLDESDGLLDLDLTTLAPSNNVARIRGGLEYGTSSAVLVSDTYPTGVQPSYYAAAGPSSALAAPTTQIDPTASLSQRPTTFLYGEVAAQTGPGSQAWYSHPVASQAFLAGGTSGYSFGSTEHMRQTNVSLEMSSATQQQSLAHSLLQQFHMQPSEDAMNSTLWESEAVNPASALPGWLGLTLSSSDGLPPLAALPLQGLGSQALALSEVELQGASVQMQPGLQQPGSISRAEMVALPVQPNAAASGSVAFPASVPYTWGGMEAPQLHEAIVGLRGSEGLKQEASAAAVSRTAQAPTGRFSPALMAGYSDPTTPPEAGRSGFSSESVDGDASLSQAPEVGMYPGSNLALPATSSDTARHSTQRKRGVEEKADRPGSKEQKDMFSIPPRLNALESGAQEVPEDQEKRKKLQNRLFQAQYRKRAKEKAEAQAQEMERLRVENAKLRGDRERFQVATLAMQQRTCLLESEIQAVRRQLLPYGDAPKAGGMEGMLADAFSQFMSIIYSKPITVTLGDLDNLPVSIAKLHADGVAMIRRHLLAGGDENPQSEPGKRLERHMLATRHFRVPLYFSSSTLRMAIIRPVPSNNIKQAAVVMPQEQLARVLGRMQLTRTQMSALVRARQSFLAAQERLLNQRRAILDELTGEVAFTWGEDHASWGYSQALESAILGSEALKRTAFEMNAEVGKLNAFMFNHVVSIAQEAKMFVEAYPYRCDAVLVSSAVATLIEEEPF